MYGPARGIRPLRWRAAARRFDNMKAVGDACSEVWRRWKTELMARAEEWNLTTSLCRPHRAKSKGKIVRVNGYLSEAC